MEDQWNGTKTWRFASSKINNIQRGWQGQSGRSDLGLFTLPTRPADGIIGSEHPDVSHGKSGNGKMDAADEAAHVNPLNGEGSAESSAYHPSRPFGLPRDGRGLATKGSRISGINGKWPARKEGKK